METIIINKTPHDVHIVAEVEGKIKIVRTYPRSGYEIRLSVKVVPNVPLSDGTPTTRTQFGNPEGLPDFQIGVMYIVSQLVKNALPHRTDLLVPAEVERDKNGVILGCKSLGR